MAKRKRPAACQKTADDPHRDIEEKILSIYAKGMASSIARGRRPAES
jgi:hypothetical protein